MDEDIEMVLTTTIEHITQLPSPKPHSVFVLKGLDKKKTFLIFPAHVSLIDGELYNLAANPPAPITLQLLQPASTNRLSFEETPTHLLRLLKSRRATQHAELGFMAPSTGDKASDIERFGGERQYLAAKSWRQHTVDNLNLVSAMRMLGYLLHHGDHALFTIICKSFQREWTELVQGETFICGGGCGETRRFDETGYTFELVLERAAVGAAARKAVQDGVRVCGFKVLELLASPTSGNVVLSCQHCSNICKGTVTPTQQAAILARICINPSADQHADVEMVGPRALDCTRVFCCRVIFCAYPMVTRGLVGLCILRRQGVRWSRSRSRRRRRACRWMRTSRWC